MTSQKRSLTLIALLHNIEWEMYQKHQTGKDSGNHDPNCMTKKIWNKNNCKHSKTRVKHIKGSKERYLLGQNTTNCMANKLPATETVNRRMQLNYQKAEYPSIREQIARLGVEA